jgi:pyruvate-formate lyase-activating enzyme
MCVELMQTIVQQAGKMGTSCVELSGGGEPLDHPEAETILQILVDGRILGLETGLLTNGLAVAAKPALANAVSKLDYVRVGFTEYLDEVRHDREEGHFWEALEILGRKRMENSTGVRIGVKLLLTSANIELIDERVRKLLDLKVSGTGQHIVDHIKIKSIRGEAVAPDPEKVRKIEHRLAITKASYGRRAKDLQMDMKSAEVPGNYRCWISPIMSVIDASGDVYLCCNFYENPSDSRIGVLGISGTGRFEDFWGGPQHRSVMAGLQPHRVCNSPLGCHCRLVHYQELAERFVPYSDRAAPMHPPFFEGHAKIL